MVGCYKYGAHHVITDVKKTTLFRKGLCAKIHEKLMSFQSWFFNQLMSGAIWQEDAIRATKEEKRGKRAASGPSGGAPPKYRMVYTLPVGQPRGPP
jgi:predicted ATPase